MNPEGGPRLGLEPLTEYFCAPTTEEKIQMVLKSIGTVLREKNRRYGDSALHPIKVFSKADTDVSLYVRADDKLSRIKNNETLRKNDVADLLGYLILICIANNWLDFSDQID